MTTGTVTDFPRVTTVRDDWITLSDGCRLFARTVLPQNAEEDSVPAVLEYLPYRLTDGTAMRDATHHPYFAGHGFGSVRVDIRGTGNSDGILVDEYLPQEAQDACEVIEWLARQSWCSGSVGIYGKSWGGFNGLQIAARRPPALRAVISAYYTDDRYADDVHYMGGCVLGHEALSWASYMLGLNALSPDPEIVGERWREMWLTRLTRTPFYLEHWLRHQRRDEFWRQGSICEDYGALQAPVLLVGGWADGYTNAVTRTLAGLIGAGVPCRALIGPWSHGWPEVADFPPDQRGEDGLALTYTSEPLTERLEVLGVPELTLALTVDRPLALVAARLCDVAADGRSLLVARGLLNLSHRHDHATPEPMAVGEPMVVTVPLDLTGHAFAPGHRIRLAIGCTYWPFAWPSPEPVALEVLLGGATALTLPVRAPDPADERLAPFAPAERAAPAAGHVRSRPWRTTRRERAPARVTLEVGGDEHTWLERERLEFGERVSRRFSVSEGEPLSARVDCRGDHFVQRGDWRVSIRLRTSMSATGESFLVSRELDAFEGDVRAHSTRGSVEIARDGV